MMATRNFHILKSEPLREINDNQRERKEETLTLAAAILPNCAFRPLSRLAFASEENKQRNKGKVRKEKEI